MSSCASSMGSRPPPRPSRIFIDTSILFAAALSDTGFTRDLILAGARGRLDLVFSAIVIEETRRNLAAKTPRALPFFETFLALELVQVVDPPAALVRQVAVDIALKDAPIVAGAVHAAAKFLATYDRKHLLAQAALIQDRFGITMGTPEAVLAAIE
jgi:predicted nucleic acid-binding protein